MPDEPLTFSELRKIQKQEQREDDLTELDEKFILNVSNYLDMKKETSGDSREYRNARRVFDKIISLREEKIVRNARIAVKSGINPSELNLLPSEQELYRDLEKVMKEHRERTGSLVEDDAENTADELEQTGEELETVKKETEAAQKQETEKKEKSASETAEIDENSDDEGKSEDRTEDVDMEETEEPEEGYQVIRITSDVPEFMGTDLETYGPFDEGDKAQVPEDNAEILVNRGNAEEIS